MNTLPIAKRIQILSMLCEGSSMRAISRVWDISFNTVSKLLVDAGEAALEMHDELVRGVKARRIQCDEIWSFNNCKQKNIQTAKAAPVTAGDTWTWTGLDADSKLLVSFFVGDRSSHSAMALMKDLQARLANRIQLTTDGLRLYVNAIEAAFGGDIDYPILHKLYSTPSKDEQRRYSPAACCGTVRSTVCGHPIERHISTSFVERSNLSMRMSMRRFTRLTNGFSKKLMNHIYMVALYTVSYNFIRIHKSLRMTPAMAAGVVDRLFDFGDILARIDAKLTPAKRGPRGRIYEPDY